MNTFSPLVLHVKRQTVSDVVDTPQGRREDFPKDLLLVHDETLKNYYDVWGPFMLHGDHFLENSKIDVSRFLRDNRKRSEEAQQMARQALVFFNGITTDDRRASLKERLLGKGVVTISAEEEPSSGVMLDMDTFDSFTSMEVCTVVYVLSTDPGVLV